METGPGVPPLEMTTTTTTENPMVTRVDVESAEPAPPVTTMQEEKVAAMDDKGAALSTAALLASLAAAPTNWHQAMICASSVCVSSVSVT